MALDIASNTLVGKGGATFKLANTVVIFGITTMRIISITPIKTPIINKGYIMADLSLSLNSISRLIVSFKSFSVTSRVPASSEALMMLIITLSNTLGNFAKDE